MNRLAPGEISAKEIVAPTMLPEFDGWHIWGVGMYVNDSHFYEEVLCRQKFDAICYTANRIALELVDGRCKCLLCCKFQGLVPEKVKFAVADNIHTKAYFMQDGAVWVGSMNLVIPGGWHNVMVEVTDRQADLLKLYKNRLWRAVKECKIDSP